MCTSVFCVPQFKKKKKNTQKINKKITCIHLVLQRSTLYSFRGQTPLDMHLLYIGL